MSLPAKTIASIVKKHQRAAKDTGSPEVQVAVLTAKIDTLTEHFKSHKHDYDSRKGLLRAVGQRRKLLDYLKEKDLTRYRALIDQLNLRY